MWTPSQAQLKACSRAASQSYSLRDDCFQEALIALWEAGEDGRGAQMHAIAWNTVVDFLRSWLGRDDTARSDAEHVEWDDAYSPAHFDTPEAWVSLWQTVRLLDAMPGQRACIEARLRTAGPPPRAWAHHHARAAVERVFFAPA